MSIDRASAPSPARPPRAPDGGPAAGGRRLGAALVAPAVLVAVVLLRFWPTLAAPVSRIDEKPYLDAMEAVRDGKSPYSVRLYLYPPPLAVLGSHAVERFGTVATRTGLRAATVVGSVAVVWLAATLLPWPPAGRLAAAAAYLVAAPGVVLAIRTGNVSPVAAAMLLLGLFGWRRFPVWSGLLLGASIAWKPIGVVVAPLLLAHRPLDGGRRHLVAGAAAVLAAAVVLSFGARYLPDFVRFGAELPSEDFRVSRTVSLHRLLLSLGLPVDRLFVSAAVAAALLALARTTRPMTREQLMCFAVAGACLTTPALWPHTFLVTLPVQVLALAAAVEATRRAGEAPARRHRIYELLAVVLGVLALHWSDSVGSLDPAPSLALAAAMTPAVLAPPLLAWYAIRRGEPHALGAPRARDSQPS